MSDKHYDALPKAHTTYANIVKSLLPIGNSGKALFLVSADMNKKPQKNDGNVDKRHSCFYR